MVFPDDDLVQLTEIALGADINGNPALWSWTDISEYVQIADSARITVKRGSRNDSGSASPATCEFQVDNADGRFCIENPLGAYYPLLGTNTPVRVSVSADAGATWSVRYSGYFKSLPISWSGPSGSTSWVRVTATSILSRLDKEPARSPLARTAPALGTAGQCLEYWSMEDGQAATECTSGLVGGYPMTLSGSLETGRSTPPPGSLATVMSDYEFMAAQPPSATGLVRPYTSTGEWSVLGCFRIESDALWSVTLMDCGINVGEGSADPDQVRLVVTQDLLTLMVYDQSDTLLGSVSTGTLTTLPPGDGEWHAVAVRAVQVGSDVQFRIQYEGVAYPLTLTSKTLGTISRVAFPAAHINTAPQRYSVGHLAVYSDDLPATYFIRYRQAVGAYVGQNVTDRLTRTDTESGMMYQLTSLSSVASMLERLGEQPVANTAGILDDTAEADGGLYYEPRDIDTASLVYKSRNYLNTTVLGVPQLTLTQDDYSVLGHTHDDHYLTTKATVTGAGSTATATAGTVQNETAVSANIAFPYRLPDMAGWAVYQGTRPDPRFPSLRVPLHGATGLVAAWSDAEIGDLVRLDEPPAGFPNALDLLLEGYTETIGPREWTVDLYCSPASRYRIARLDDTVYGRMDTASSRLVNAADAAATGLDVETVEGPEWSTSATGIDVGVGGERMTVASIAGAFSDAFTRTVASGWGTSTSGHTWATTGGSAADYSVNGSRGIMSLGVVGSLRGAYISALPVANIDRTVTVRVPVLATGAGIQARNVARWDVSANTYYAAMVRAETTQAVTLQLLKVVAGVTTTLRAKTVPGLTHTATLDLRVRFKVQGSWLYAKVWDASTAEPAQWTDAAWDSEITAAGSWGCRGVLNSGNTNVLPVLVQFDTDTVATPQRVTVTRAVNNVPKAHAAGDAFGLFQPNYLGL